MKFKPVLFLLFFLINDLLAGCAGTPKVEPTPVPTPAAAVFKTPLGDLEHTFTRLVQGVNSTVAPAGSMVLLVGLRRPDGSPIDLQAFQEAHMEIFVQTESGEKIMSTMGGLVGAEYQDFAIGFLVPEGGTAYTLLWGDNPPVAITPE